MSACFSILQELVSEDDFYIESVPAGNNKPAKDFNDDPARILPLESVQELDKKFLVQNYKKFPVVFTYGSGEFLYDTSGEQYYDFISGIAVTNLGHAHPDLIATLQNQADLLWHTSNLYYNQQQVQLAKALIELSFPGKVFFCNSGAEANEALFKLARAYGQQLATPVSRIIALEGSFHGRTTAGMSMTGQEKIRHGFGDLIGEVVWVKPGDMQALEQAFSKPAAAFVAEPVQGEGGVLPLPKDYLIRAHDLCKEQKALFLLDEVQIGMGRSGHYFAFQHYGLTPDAVSLAKGLGGGFPIGAIIIADQFADVIGPGTHGSTFGGNHLAAAVSYELIRTIESQNILSHVQNSAGLFSDLLSKLVKKYPDIVKEERGLGLLRGLVLENPALVPEVVQGLFQAKVLVARAGEDVVRFAPPLTLRPSSIEEVILRLDQVLEALSSK